MGSTGTPSHKSPVFVVPGSPLIPPLTFPGFCRLPLRYLSPGGFGLGGMQERVAYRPAQCPAWRVSVLDLIVFMPHREDSLGARLLSWLLLPGLCLPGEPTGKGPLPSWCSSWSWLCVVPLLAGVMPLPTSSTTEF